MDFGRLAAFWVISFSLVLTPGPDWAYAISAGLRDGAIVPAVTGLLLGYVMITLIVAAGVGAFVASAPVILTVLTVVGAGYLLWLGLNTLTHPPNPTADDSSASYSWSGWVARGFTVSGANPKALLLFLALLPQFTSRVAVWPVSAQIAALGCVQIINCALFYTLVGIGSKIVLRTQPERARMLGQFSGAAMIVIAFLLILEEFVN